MTRRSRRAVELVAVLAAALAATALSACSASTSSSTASTLGPQTTVSNTHGYTCVDPKGDISLDPKSSAGKLTSPAGIDILTASAHQVGSNLEVQLVTAAPITTAPGPLFDIELGDISVAPDQSFELRARPANADKPAGEWVVELHTFKNGSESTTDLTTAVHFVGNTMSYSVPLSQLPPIVTLQWQFGTSASFANGTTPFDDCNSFSAAPSGSTTTG
jgi:hypothetical protein